MNDKEFTDNFFKTMYELGYRKAEIEKGCIFFYKEPTTLNVWAPRIPTKCTCFTDEPQCIDIAEYLGIADWSKVAVDTPILVRDFETSKWEKRHFASFKNGRVHAWGYGVTSWTCESPENTMSWKYAKLAEV